jgi:hypothetical protein
MQIPYKAALCERMESMLSEEILKLRSRNSCVLDEVRESG